MVKNKHNHSTEGKYNRQTKFNEQVITDNQRKCKFVSKIINKVVMVANKEFSLRNLKNCAIRNLNNMRDKINESGINTSLDNVKSRKRASTSLCDLNSSKRRKSCTLDEEVTSKTKANSAKHKISYESSDSDEDNHNKSYLSKNKSLFDTSKCSINGKTKGESEKENKSDDNDAERSQLIEDLVNQQKKRLRISHATPEDDTSDSGMSDSQFLNDREFRGKDSLTKIKDLRKLPDYKKIEEFLNTPLKTYYQKNIHSSLNALPKCDESKTIQHWNKYSFLCRKVEQCVLNKEWHHLTKLLILLSDAPKHYKPFLLKSTVINLFCNPAVQKDESMIEKFLRTCYACQTDDDIERVLGDLFHIKDIIKTDEDEKDPADEEEKYTADEGL